MEPITKVAVQVTGGREASAPATWGHQAVQRWLDIVPDATHFVLGAAYELPAGCRREAVTDAIGHVLWRYDALRTLFRVDGNALRQFVQGSGEVIVDVYDAGPDDAEETADAVASQLASIPLRNGQEWPIRFAIVEKAESPVFLVVASDRIAFDGHGAKTIVTDILNACSGEYDKALPRWQPLEEAAYEQSPEGLAVSERAIGYWRQTLGTAPASIFDFPLHPEGELRYCHMQLTSAALSEAMRLLRARARLSASCLLLAAAGVVLSQYTGHEDIVMRTVAGNRLGRDRKSMIGTLATEGLLLLNVTGLSFGALARGAFRASGSANQFAFCDPAAVEAAWDDLRLRRGAYLDLGACFSDIQGGFSESGTDPAGEPTLDEERLQQLAARTTLTESSTPTGIMGLRLFLTAMDFDDITLRLSCDTRYVPPEPMRQILYGMERLLVRAACRDMTAADLSEVSGVTPVSRGASWDRFGKDWVDMAEALRVWQQVAGTTQAAVVAEEPPGGQRRLVGYVAGTQPPCFTDLHRAFVAALGERSDVRAPDWYRHAACAPPQPDRPSSWLDTQVLSEASGRPLP